MARARFRGHCIYFDQESDSWRYEDNGESVPENWESRICGHCNKQNTPEGHDGCLGTLPPPVMNACCGHGVASEAYVQFSDGRETIRGEEAILYQANARATEPTEAAEAPPPGPGETPKPAD